MRSQLRLQQDPQSREAIEIRHGGSLFDPLLPPLLKKTEMGEVDNIILNANDCFHPKFSFPFSQI
jgi:hypothetical protein